MYTVPAKVPIQAKQLIATFEKGEVSSAGGDDGSTESGLRVSRQISIEELAQPGTARRLLAAFETRSVFSSGEPEDSGRRQSTNGRRTSSG